MNAWKRIRHLVHDPPPEYVFELSGQGLSWARTGAPPVFGYRPLAAGIISVSPLRDNVLQPEVLAAELLAAAPANGNRKRRRAALILPDYAARISLLDFDSFPSEASEQASLVRFRLKKSVPFDIESAAISFQTQPSPGGGKRVEVVAAVVLVDVLARYEAVLRAANFHPGLVTISAIPMFDLVDPGRLAVVTRLNGSVLTTTVLDHGRLRLFRCVELGDAIVEETMSMLFPTFAFVEDEVGRRAEALILCGFGPAAEELKARAGAELSAVAEPLRSRFGVPSQENAGLFGYLEALED